MREERAGRPPFRSRCGKTDAWHCHGRSQRHGPAVGDRIAKRIGGGPLIGVGGNTASPASFLNNGRGCCTTSRGMARENFKMPPSGLRGVPVGMAAKALRANGLRPFLHTSKPPAEKRSPSAPDPGG
jgi:hypothetical protein